MQLAHPGLPGKMTNKLACIHGLVLTLTFVQPAYMPNVGMA